MNNKEILANITIEFYQRGKDDVLNSMIEALEQNTPDGMTFTKADVLDIIRDAKKASRDVLNRALAEVRNK